VLAVSAGISNVSPIVLPLLLWKRVSIGNINSNTATVHCVSKNVPPYCGNNSLKSSAIFNILSPLESLLNLQQNYITTTATPKICCRTTLRNCGIKIMPLQTSLQCLQTWFSATKVGFW